MARNGDLSLVVLQGVGPSSILTISVGALASIVCPRYDRTMAKYNGINADVDNSTKDQWTIKSNRLAVFAVLLQCPAEVKVMPRGTPRSHCMVAGRWG